VLGLFESYGIDPPLDLEDPESLRVPATYRDACRVAAANERATIALYDRLLEGAPQADIRDVFTRLREVARVRHLPAFERCAARSGRGR
jgi:rubrerythrin